MSEDVIVVGGGLAGYVAALSAARADPDAAVTVLAEGDRFDLETGLIDVLGYDADGDPVTDPLDAIGGLPAEHPYARLGTDTVREALSLFADAVGEHYVGTDRSRNALFPTATGGLTPALGYPESFAPGVASADRPMRLLGFERVADFDAELAAERLDDRLPYDVTGERVTTAMAVADPPVAVGMANLLDGDRKRWDHLADTLADELDVEPRVGVPAVLGEEDTDEIRRFLSEQLHAEVFEVPLGPPSVPGRRLESLLADALADRDIAVERGVEVTAVESHDGTVESVTARRPGDGSAEPTTYEASAFVLAPGGITAGGLHATGTAVTEPLFDCPVAVPDTGAGLADRAFLGDHPAIRAGVETADRLRPVDSGDDPAYENLHAAGRVLNSPNVVAERSASGLSLVTGFEAGRQAIE
ncbi:MAG: glycerol-3-phosphate dehydrogenase subunit GlpB [Natrialbaceae archaeon]